MAFNSPTKAQVIAQTLTKIPDNIIKKIQPEDIRTIVALILDYAMQAENSDNIAEGNVNLFMTEQEAALLAELDLIDNGDGTATITINGVTVTIGGNGSSDSCAFFDYNVPNENQNSWSFTDISAPVLSNDSSVNNKIELIFTDPNVNRIIATNFLDQNGTPLADLTKYTVRFTVASVNLDENSIVRLKFAGGSGASPISIDSNTPTGHKFCVDIITDFGSDNDGDLFYYVNGIGTGGSIILTDFQIGPEGCVPCTKLDVISEIYSAINSIEGVNFEGYEESGTRAGEDLFVVLGDYDDSGLGTKIIISDEDEEISILAGDNNITVDSDTINLSSSNPIALGSKSSNNATIATTLTTAVRNFELPDKSGTFALLDDLGIVTGTDLFTPIRNLFTQSAKLERQDVLFINHADSLYDGKRIGYIYNEAVNNWKGEFADLAYSNLSLFNCNDTGYAKYNTEGLGKVLQVIADHHTLHSTTNGDGVILRVAFGNNNSQYADTAAYAAGLNQYIATIRASYPNVTFLLVEMPASGNLANESMINAAFNQVSASESIAISDINTMTNLVYDGGTNDWMVDSIHFYTNMGVRVRNYELNLIQDDFLRHKQPIIALPSDPSVTEDVNLITEIIESGNERLSNVFQIPPGGFKFSFQTDGNLKLVRVFETEDGTGPHIIQYTQNPSDGGFVDFSRFWNARSGQAVLANDGSTLDLANQNLRFWKYPSVTKIMSQDEVNIGIDVRNPNRDWPEIIIPIDDPVDPPSAALIPGTVENPWNNVTNAGGSNLEVGEGYIYPSFGEAFSKTANVFDIAAGEDFELRMNVRMRDDNFANTSVSGVESAYNTANLTATIEIGTDITNALFKGTHGIYTATTNGAGIIENQAFINNWEPIVEGDLLKIRRVSDIVTMWKGSDPTPFYTSGLASTGAVKVKVNCGKSGFKNIELEIL